MPGYDRQWAERQLAHAGADPWVEETVVDLLEVLAASDVPDGSVALVATYFAELARGRHIAPEQAVAAGPWVPARLGQIRPGQQVRVSPTAFRGELGRLHNGRIGVVVEVSDGDVIVRSIDDREPRLMAAHYAPYVLEELMPR